MSNCQGVRSVDIMLGGGFGGVSGGKLGEKKRFGK